MNIYVLQDPRDHEIRYVGRTINSLNGRLSAHIGAAKRSPRKYHRLEWIRSVLACGLQPYATLIQVVPDDAWEDAEIYWIAYFRSIGCDLTNSCDGGRGILHLSPESGAKIAAANRLRPPPVWTAESREKLSRSKKGVPSSLLGRHLPEEHRIKIGLGQLGRVSPNKGKTASAETRRKMSEASKGRRCPTKGGTWSAERRAAQPKTYKKRA